jgi:AspT/YidE/YbjL antiporter-like protein
VLVLALTASLGLVIGSAKVRGVRFGVAGVLFSGLLFGHFGAIVTLPVLEFARDFGLVLFVYAIGIEVGPGFTASLRRRGLPLNLIAAGTVIAGAVVAVAISRVAGIAVPVAVGMFSGATTNTPSLGAAQAALSEMPGYPGAGTQLPGLGYAVSYPFGLFGVILSVAIARSALHGRADSTSVPLPADGPPVTAVAGGTPASPAAEVVPGRPESLQVLPVFIGIALGVLVGSIPIHIASLPAPLRLGMAGGPLVVAIALGAIGRLGRLDWRMPRAVDATFREVGIVLFLSCVGLRAGGTFVETLLHGGGLRWMAWATLITLIPIIAAALVARGMLRISSPALCGLLTGSMTNPAALAFAQSLERSPETTQCYATVYPLTMVLRVIAAQLIVLLYMR